MPRGHYPRVNGTTPAGIPKALYRLLEYYEGAAQSIRTTIELMTAEATGSSQRRMSTTLNTALVIDGMRRDRAAHEMVAAAIGKQRVKHVKPTKAPERKGHRLSPK